MISSVGRRLRVTFDRHPAPTEVPAPADAPPPSIEFVAYAEDCLLWGRVQLDGERLTDMLEANDEFDLVDVLVERLEDGATTEVAEVVAYRTELLLIHATGPRGSADRRLRTQAHPIAAQVGPYQVRGYLHASLGHDPLVAIRRRGVMVPLTEATIELVSEGLIQRRPAGTLVLNRDWLEWAVSVPTVDGAGGLEPAFEEGALDVVFPSDDGGLRLDLTRMS